MQRLFRSPSAEINADTPCTGHCSTALGDDICRSCLRTFDEITRWVEMNEDERRAVNLRIALQNKTPNPPQPSLVREGALHSSPDAGQAGNPRCGCSLKERLGGLANT